MSGSSVVIVGNTSSEEQKIYYGTNEYTVASGTTKNISVGSATQQSFRWTGTMNIKSTTGSPVIVGFSYAT